jgi:hypothetical protein
MGNNLGRTELPFASLVSVLGTRCRCTVSREALSALAGTRELGPHEAYQVFEERRAEIEAIARWKHTLLGCSPSNVIAVRSEDVHAHAVAADRAAAA